MTTRREFFRGAVAVTAAGWVAWRSTVPVEVVTPGSPHASGTMVDFYALDAGDHVVDGRVIGGTGRLPGDPIRVDLRSLEVGHLHNLVYLPDGRVAYLYLATIPGHSARRGLVKLDDLGLLTVA